jgi:hypothetical protein
MPSAIELLREQRKAVEEVHVQLLEVARLLTALGHQADALASDKDLRAVLSEERAWLAEARHLVAEVRRLRETEDYRWPARWRRHLIAVTLGLAAAAAAGAGYRVLENREWEETLRAQAAFGEAVQDRLDALTAAERREVERLLNRARPRR